MDLTLLGCCFCGCRVAFCTEHYCTVLSGAGLAILAESNEKLQAVGMNLNGQMKNMEIIVSRGAHSTSDFIVTVVDVHELS